MPGLLLRQPGQGRDLGSRHVPETAHVNVQPLAQGGELPAQTRVGGAQGDGGQAVGQGQALQSGEIPRGDENAAAVLGNEGMGIVQTPAPEQDLARVLLEQKTSGTWSRATRRSAGAAAAQE